MKSLLGIVLLVLSIIALIEIWKGGGDVTKKLLWTVLILLFPLVGLIIYYLVSRNYVHV